MPARAPSANSSPGNLAGRFRMQTIFTRRITSPGWQKVSRLTMLTAGRGWTGCATNCISISAGANPPWMSDFEGLCSIRRDCLDHVTVLNDRHLKRILIRYFDYYHRARTHLSLEMDSPESRSAQPPALGKIVQFPEVGGLHHH